MLRLTDYRVLTLDCYGTAGLFPVACSRGIWRNPMSLRCWRSVAEGLGSNLVVFPSPAFNQNLRLDQSVTDLEV